MKKTLILLAALTLLTGCSADTYPDDPPDSAKAPAETSAVSDETPVVWDSEETPVKLTYTFMGETKEEYVCDDSALIGECVSALKEIKVGEPVDKQYTDQLEILKFEFKDSDAVTVKFEHKNFVCDSKRYSAENTRALYKVLDKIKGE